MKLIFKKEENQNIQIQLVTGTSTIDFTYIEMIKDLIKNNEIETPIFEGDISEEEKDRLNAMLKKISESIIEKETE